MTSDFTVRLVRSVPFCVYICLNSYKNREPFKFVKKKNFHSYRWPLPTAARSLSSHDARADGPWSQSLCPHGRSHSNCPGSSRGSYHCDRTTGGNVPDLTGADCVSALSAGNHHPHLPRCRPHEHTLLPLLLLCRVGISQVRSRAEKGSVSRLIKVT